MRSYWKGLRVEHDPEKARRGYEEGIGKRSAKPPTECGFCPGTEDLVEAKMGYLGNQSNRGNIVGVCKPCLAELDVRQPGTS